MSRSDDHDPRVAYAIDVLVEGSNDRSSICYGVPDKNDSTPTIWIVPSGFFGAVYGTPGSLPSLPLPRLEDTPVLFGRPHVQRHGKGVVVHADIVASSYFLLTRYEEWVRSDVRDHHGRFPGRASLPYRAGFVERPLVNEYSAMLRRWHQSIGIHPVGPRRSFSVLLTHDADHIRTKRGVAGAVRSLGAGLLGARPPRAAVDGARAALGLIPDPADNLAEVLALDRILHPHTHTGRCRSIFFFLAGGSTRYDATYDIQSAVGSRWVRDAMASGAEIGLHASYDAGGSTEQLGAERTRLETVAGRPVHKNRHHYLRWQEASYGVALSAAGLTWDSSMGYADVAGFRLGTCHPTPLFCPARRVQIGVEEHPLIVMDRTLCDSKYMGLDPDASFDLVRRLAAATHRHGGEFVVLWHNDVLASTGPLGPGPARLYRRVLSHLDELLAH